MRKQWLLIVLAAIFVEVSLAPRYLAQNHSRSITVSRSGMAQLASVEPFKEAFQKDAGKIRLVALLSPT